MVTREDKQAAIDYFSSEDVEAFSVDSRWVLDSPGLRLDAEHYNPDLAKALTLLQHSGMDLRPLGELVERIFIPPRTKRVYVDEDHGVPFLQGSHVVHLKPADLKFVSEKAQKHLDQLTIHEGWLLVTRSGTVGRAVVVPSSWDEWAASEHLLRIVPSDDGEWPIAYLYAFLMSEAGQAQLTSQIYGAVVDELTEDQTARTLVPVPVTDEQEKAVQAIVQNAKDAIRLKEEAVSLDDAAIAAAGALTPESGNGDGAATAESVTYFASGDVDAYSVESSWLLESPGLRIDAEYYNPDLARALAALKRTGMKLARLDEVTKRIFIPPRFKRIYVEEEHGVPFLQGSHVVHFKPADIKYLSRTAIKGLERWIVRSGWVLVTCSGTIGRAMIVPEAWDKWAATQHVLRIVPDEENAEVPVGYIYAFLQAPAGQAQIAARIYGAVVDELTEDHASNVLIPVPSTAAERDLVAEIDDLATRAVKTKEKAMQRDDASLEGMEALLREGADIRVKPAEEDVGAGEGMALSMYPLQPEEALGAFMEVDRDKVLEREKSEKGDD